MELNEANMKIVGLEEMVQRFDGTRPSAVDYSSGLEQNKRAITKPPPTSCADLSLLGNGISGFYLVKDNGAGNTIQTVYCDFALLYNDPSKNNSRIRFLLCICI